jgi:long-subunit fatty acid transport protein
MIKKIISITFFSMLFVSANAQKRAATDQAASLSIAFGKNQFTTALNYQYLWNFGKKKQWQMGTGARLTNNFGNKNFYITAPAKLTSGKTGPGVFFSDQIAGNIDSLYFLKTQTNVINITVNFGYKINDKFTVGFNIDAIGFSFGGSQAGTYYGNAGTVVATNAKPTGFNLLLVSDNDLGTLNSEFFGQYNFNKKWAGKIGFQFLFTEYTTSTKVQTTPSGEKNDRFRNKSGELSVGATYQF